MDRPVGFLSQSLVREFLGQVAIFWQKRTVVSQAYFLLESVIYVLFELFACHINSQLPKMPPHAERFWQLSLGQPDNDPEGRAPSRGDRGTRSLVRSFRPFTSYTHEFISGTNDARPPG